MDCLDRPSHVKKQKTQNPTWKNMKRSKKRPIDFPFGHLALAGHADPTFKNGM
jgi:hypothetical protein